jgi:cystathionine gamma-synthase
MSQLQPRTRAVRAAIATDKEHGAVAPPIHLSATFAFEGFGKPRTYDYTRSGNPTRSQLAETLAQLEGGDGAVVTSTGMSAVLLCLQLVNPGDTIVAAHDCYGGTQRLLRSLAKRNHFNVVFTDLTCHPERSEGSAVDQADGVIPRSEATRDLHSLFWELSPRIVWIETPSNPLLRITDIRAVAEAAHAAGSIVVVDNTFLSPALQQPIGLGADLVVHSTTKYLNGHSDVVGGAVIARDKKLVEELTWWANCLGITGAPFDSYLTLRGVRTLHSRIRDHLAGAEAVVQALSSHPAVTKVYYPGLESHPGHALAKAQQSGFGAMVSFEILGGTPAVEVLAANLKCFTLAESLGGVESLVAHPASMTHASMEADTRAVAGISDSLVRLSVGIESPDDLVVDLTRALDETLKSKTKANGESTRREQSVRHPERSEGSAVSEVVLLGVGSIGRELISQLNAQPDHNLRVVGLIDSSGFVFEEHGIDAERLEVLRVLKAAGSSLASTIGGQRADGIQALHEISRHKLSRPVLVDATPADTSFVLQLALSRGFDLVLANKVPLASEQSSVDHLHELAARTGRTILHEATVGAGLPVLDTIRKLQEAGDSVLSIEGCPSGTLGYLFGELGKGEKFSDALERAIALGYTEPDPRVDLSGVDVARKALILARAIGWRGEQSAINVESLVPTHLVDGPREEFLSRLADLDRPWASRVNEARKKGRVLRYRATVTPESIKVGLAEVRLTESLGILQGTDNQFTFTTKRYLSRPLVITGPGAGPSVTAAGVFNDLLRLDLSRERQGAAAPAILNQPGTRRPRISRPAAAQRAP